VILSLLREKQLIIRFIKIHLESASIAAFLRIDEKPSRKKRIGLEKKQKPQKMQGFHTKGVGVVSRVAIRQEWVGPCSRTMG